MTTKRTIIILILIFAFSSFSVFSQNTKSDENSRLNELNNYWSEVSRAVNEGDFEAYVNTCDTKGVLVEGIGKKAYPLFYDLVTDPKEEHPISAYIADTWVDYPLYQVLEDFEESLAKDPGTPGPRW